VILNNGVHDSVGGQPTVGLKIDFIKIAKACGYAAAWRCSSSDEVKFYLSDFLQRSECSLMEIRLQPGGSDDLPRPPSDFQASKQLFIENLMNQT
jgi:phosphonopyruvate decarboxylase